MKLLGSLWVVVAIVLSGITVANAQEPQKRTNPTTAADWNSRGVQHRKDGEHEKALEAFQKADELERTPKSRGQLGFVEHDLGRYVAAEEHLGEALEAKSDPWVTKNRKFLAEALDLTKRHLGYVKLGGGESGATVTIQAKPVGVMPIDKPIRVEEGEVLITVNSPGRLTWQQPDDPNRYTRKLGPLFIGTQASTTREEASPDWVGSGGYWSGSCCCGRRLPRHHSQRVRRYRMSSRASFCSPRHRTFGRRRCRWPWRFGSSQLVRSSTCERRRQGIGQR